MYEQNREEVDKVIKMLEEQQKKKAQEAQDSLWVELKWRGNDVLVLCIVGANMDGWISQFPLAVCVFVTFCRNRMQQDPEEDPKPTDPQAKLEAVQEEVEGTVPF